eukprot:s224_g14.t1
MTYSSTVRAKELLGEVISITALLTDDEALRLSCGFTVEEEIAELQQFTVFALMTAMMARPGKHAPQQVFVLARRELLAKRRLAGDLLKELAEHLDRVCRDTGIARTTGGGTATRPAACP